MIQTIGLMIAVYIFFRAVELGSRHVGEGKLLVPALAAITGLASLVGGASLLMGASNLPPGLR